MNTVILQSVLAMEQRLLWAHHDAAPRYLHATNCSDTTKHHG